nr:hypothetical protein BaRGS_024009 [Batillaria attramentaria]
MATTLGSVFYDQQLRNYNLANSSFFNMSAPGTTSFSQTHNTSRVLGLTDAHTLIIPSSLGIQIVAFTIMVSVCSVFGTLGNIPVLIVYCKRQDKRTANTFIKVLAVIDLVVCAIIMPYTIVFELHLVTSDVACRLLEFLRHLAVSASNLTLVAIAVERYVAVCVIGHRLTVRNVKIGMCIVMAVSAVTAAPAVGIFAAVTKEDLKDVNCSFPHSNFADDFVFCHFTTSIMGPMLTRIYQAVLMITFFVTFIVIVVFYTIVYTALWKRAKRRSRQSMRTDFENESSVSLDKRRSAASFHELSQDGGEANHNGHLMLEAAQGGPMENISTLKVPEDERKI